MENFIVEYDEKEESMNLRFQFINLKLLCQLRKLTLVKENWFKIKTIWVNVYILKEAILHSE